VPASPLPYQRLFDQHSPDAHGWDGFVGKTLVPLWLEAYDRSTSWPTQVMEIVQGALTYLFDMAPSTLEVGDDRVVAVWGLSVAPTAPRDAARQAGFIPAPAKWSQAGHDRGHFVSHAAGGDMDINFFPQAKDLNRGIGDRGRTWRAMERLTAAQAGTPLLVRPTYADATWIPEDLDFGVVADGRLRVERFTNRDDP
jgi:hypothetical protein